MQPIHPRFSGLHLYASDPTPGRGKKAAGDTADGVVYQAFLIADDKPTEVVMNGQKLGTCKYVGELCKELAKGRAMYTKRFLRKEMPRIIKIAKVKAPTRNPIVLAWRLMTYLVNKLFERQFIDMTQAAKEPVTYAGEELSVKDLFAKHQARLHDFVLSPKQEWHLMESGEHRTLGLVAAEANPPRTARRK